MTDTITCKNNFGQYVEVPKEKFVFRPSAYGIVLFDKKILLLRNKSNGKLWVPGGGIEIGEKLEDGLLREIKEETGIDAETEKLLFFRENFFYYQPLDEAYHAFLFFFLCKPKNYVLLKDENVDDLESEKPRWVPFSEINKNDFADFSEDIFASIRMLIQPKTTSHF